MCKYVRALKAATDGIHVHYSSIFDHIIDLVSGIIFFQMIFGSVYIASAIYQVNKVSDESLH